MKNVKLNFTEIIRNRVMFSCSCRGRIFQKIGFLIGYIRTSQEVNIKQILEIYIVGRSIDGRALW